jgi:cob(I)alamin adenosyltransferase
MVDRNLNMTTGLIHIYTGDGKGKTTAAVGVSVRALSRGLRVLFVQFFKEEDSQSESSTLQRIGITTLNFDEVKSPLFNPDIDKSSLQAKAAAALSRLNDIFMADSFDMMVLDEFICLISEGILKEDDALKFLRSKPKSLELVLTGKGASPSIINAADYVTYMKNIKHPYDKKMPARKGIEF